MEPVLDGKLANPLNLDGLEFVEFAAPNTLTLEPLFNRLGFQKIGVHKRKAVTLYRQNQINFVVNHDPGSFAAKFAKQHGPSISAIGLRVRNAQRAFELAVARGARKLSAKPDGHNHSFPAIFGVGDSAIYFVDRFRAPVHFDDDFRYLQPELQPKGRGLVALDSLTFNVPKGDLVKWADFFQSVLHFREVSRATIKGEATGLALKRLRSPCEKIRFSVQEPTEGKSQVQEFLDEYRGAGVQSLAFTSLDLANSARALRQHEVEPREIPEPAYYGELATRVPGLDSDELRDTGIWVEGHAGGYILHLFTRNLIGPIYFSVFQARGVERPEDESLRVMFAAIERDQQRRGYL